MTYVVRRRGVGVAMAGVLAASAAGGCAASRAGSAADPSEPQAAQQATLQAAQTGAAQTAAAVSGVAQTGAAVSASTAASIVVAPTPTAALPQIRTHPLHIADLPPPPRGPVSVSIDRLHLSAPVLPVGSTTAGELAVPDSASVVGWYQHGSVPGEPGVAVLAAHVDLHGVRGVFFDLVELRKGDGLSVNFAGKQYRYRVSEKKQVAKADVASLGIFDNQGPSRLVLVTCGGSFDRSARSYRDNVVVTAVPA